jgi:putative transposase
MLKAFRYRLYPTKAQQTKLNETLESLRWVYNETLAVRKNTWEQEHKSVSLFKTNKLLTQWKKGTPRTQECFQSGLAGRSSAS